MPVPMAGWQAWLGVQVTLLEARHLPVWGFPWQSNPYCRLKLGAQTVHSRRDDDTSRAGSHRAPVWNQEFQLLVESPSSQVSAFGPCSDAEADSAALDIGGPCCSSAITRYSQIVALRRALAKCKDAAEGPRMQYSLAVSATRL